MNTINHDARITYTINKSEFITSIKKVNSVLDAKAFFEKVKKEFPDATHHITVYIIGKTGEKGHYSDDGEPSGTAGLPVLEVFRKNNLTNLACVVTRYFGGIKLGAGGLVRAYSSAASLVLKEAGITELVEYSYLKLIFNYNYLDLIENRLKNFTILSKEFTKEVKLLIEVPLPLLNEVINMLIMITNNMIKIEQIPYNIE